MQAIHLSEDQIEKLIAGRTVDIILSEPLSMISLSIDPTVDPGDLFGMAGKYLARALNRTAGPVGRFVVRPSIDFEPAPDVTTSADVSKRRLSVLANKER